MIDYPKYRTKYLFAVLNVSKNMKDKERYSYYSAEGEKKKQE